MEDMPAPRIDLVAIDRSRNIQRRYVIEWGRDLLGDWIVETHWGRIGARGQTRTEVFEGQTDAAQSVRRHLRRRASSSRRISVAYVDQGNVAAAEPAPVATEWTAKLREYRLIEGFDGWVEDCDSAILAVHPARDRVPDALLLADVRQPRPTLAWGLYADGKHIVGRELFISEWWATEAIRSRRS